MERIAEFLNPYIFVGSEGILIDGIRRICRWEDDCIQLLSLGKSITIGGKNLKLEHKSLDSLLVKGQIKTIEFEKRKLL